MNTKGTIDASIDEADHLHLPGVLVGLLPPSHQFAPALFQLGGERSHLHTGKNARNQLTTLGRAHT